MLIYNLPLAQIYFAIIILGMIMYLTPTIFNLFRWIPLVNREGNILMKVGIGALFGWGFIQFYNSVSSTPMAAVFATTLLGASEIMGKIVYSGFIPPVESVFFFVIVLMWGAWKIGIPLTVSPFSWDGVKLMAFFGGLFTLFHAGSKDIWNQTELMAVFVFGALSIALILYFQEAIEAIIMHCVVNAKSMDLWPSLTAVSSANTIYIIIAAVVAYFIFTRQSIRRMLPI